MSLFKLITWWSGQVSDSNQNLDGAVRPILCVSRFNSFDSATDTVERDTIFVGTSSGMLSVYQPSDVYYVTGNRSPTDVILECQLNEPIIDIKCGKFAMTKSDKYTIAVLHPGQVVCYGIAFAEGLAEYGKQFQLTVAFEFKLNSAPFSLCKGNFGATKSKEFFCVNHLANNDLRFFEQDGIASLGVLPEERSLPSGMLYLSRIDCFAVVAMPNDVLECYKYQDLITATADHPSVPIWSFCVGEFVLEMATHQLTNTESVIVILGEHNLICLTDGGVIKFIKKLDYEAVTFHSFVIGYYFEPDARLVIAIASAMESLFVYECSSVAGPINCKLIWSTQLPFVPVALSRANFDGMPGGIVLLGEAGNVNVSFFGTEPQIFKVPPLEISQENNQHVQQQQIHRELERLEGEIKQGVDFTDLSFINAATVRDLEVTITARPGLMPSKPQMTKRLTNLQETAKMVQVQMKLTAKVPFEQIQVAVNPPLPLAVSDNSIMFFGIEPDKELQAEFFVYVSTAQDPPSLTVPIIISMINRQGIPRIIEKSVKLSPQLILRTCPPQKEGRFKLTVTTLDTDTRDILSLFPEFATDTINQQAVGLQSIYSQDTVTIVLGKKNSTRYRIQSDSLSIMPIVTELLIQRLQRPPPNAAAAHSSIKAPDGISVVNQSYFIEQLLTTVEDHASARTELKCCDKSIENKSRQMRLFQRKLMLMLQQDPPHPAYNSAGKLLRLTHADLTELQETLMSLVDRLRASQLKLSHHLRLIKLVIHHHSKMPLQIKDNLFAVFVNPIADWIAMGWEETLAPAVEMVAHIGALGKTKQGGTVNMDDIKSSARLPFDMDRFKKNLRYILEKLESLSDSDFLELQQKERPFVEEASDWLVDSDNVNPTDNVDVEGEEEENPSVNDMDLV